ncbi:MAG: putative lipid II flippase FtsW [Firmicutes bacterium]|nr:putative lipid II flippase FtsW [Bacillota bacterium]
MLFLIVVLLLAIGVVMVFSSSSVTALRETQDAYHYLKRQLIAVVLGLVLMFITMRLNYRIYKRVAILGLAVSFVLLVLVLIIGREVYGSKRWIDLGFMNLQASEVAKLALINFAAAYASVKREEMRFWWKGFFPPLALTGAAIILVMLEPDFGTSIAIMCSVLVVLFAAGARVLHFVVIGLASIPLAGLLIYLEPYRMERILAFIDPWADPADSGWNVIQSLLAIGSGGLFGVGLGAGRQKFFYLPEQHTDFIFAVLGEELGFVGTFTVAVLFALLVWRGVRIALYAPDLFGTLLAMGITGMIGFQAILNIGVVTGSLPVTGITLPLISYGGSSLVTTLAGIGILLNISQAGASSRRN